MRVRARPTLAVSGAAASAPPAGARAPITLLRDVHRDLVCTARTVVQGTTISSFDVTVLVAVADADADGSGARILVRVSGPAVDASCSYKLAAPGHVLGTLSSDALQAVVGSVGPKPATIPVLVPVHDADRHRTVRQRTDVAQEVDVGEPTGQAALVGIAPVAVAQAVTSVVDGATASESGRLCLREALVGCASATATC